MQYPPQAVVHPTQAVQHPPQAAEHPPQTGVYTSPTGKGTEERGANGVWSTEGKFDTVQVAIIIIKLYNYLKTRIMHTLLLLDTVQYYL